MKDWRTIPHTIASVLTVVFPVLFLLGGTIPEIGMDIIAALFLTHSLISGDWEWCQKRWIGCLALLWVYMIARSLFVEPQYLAGSLTHSVVFIRYFLFAAALAYWTFADGDVRRKFMLVLGSVIVFLIGDGLIQYITGRDLIGFTAFGSPEGHVRLGGTFRKPILGIMIAWLSFPVLLDVLGKSTSMKSREFLVAVIMALLVMAVVSLSGERLALLLLLLGWAVAFLLMRGHRIKILVIVIAGLVAVAGTAAVDPFVFKRQAASTVGTLANWHQTPYGMLLTTDMKMAEINPVFGIGAYQFREVCPTLYPGMSESDLKGVCNIHPHNIYFEWLIEEGAIGLLLFVTFVVMVLTRSFNLWRAGLQDPLFIGFLIAFIMRIWPIASTTGFASRWGASPFWLALGCLIACALHKEKRS